MKRRGAFALVATSGATSLVYQVIWERMLLLCFGADDVTAVLITSTFMLGLGGGAFLFGRRYQAPLRVYALLELGIGCFGLVSYPLLDAFARTLRSSLGASLAHVEGLRLVNACSIVPFLLGPTVLMGASLPVSFACFVPHEEGADRSAGRLYGANIAGAMVGVLFAPFVLLHRLRVPTALAATAAVNLVVGISLWLAHRRTRPCSVPKQEKSLALPPLRLVAAFVSGALVLSWELVGLRHLGHLHSGSPYNFALVLVLYLAGLAAGSVFLGSSARNPSLAGIFSVASAVLVASVWGSGVLLNEGRFLPAHFALTEGPRSVLALLAYLGLLLVPFGFIQGSVFPRLLQADALIPSALSVRTGPLYLANACGSFVGGMLLHFFGWQYLGTRGVIVFLVILGSAMAWVLAIGRRERLSGVLGLFAVACVLIAPPAFFSTLAYGQDAASGSRWDAVEGQTGSALILWQDDSRLNGSLSVHGKPFGALPVTQTWIWTASFLSARPVRAHVLVLGLGTGTVLRTLVDDPDVRYIDVVDWSRELPILLSQEPMRSMTGRALDSEKVHFHTTDARTAVALAQTGFYDAVYESLTHYGPVGSTYYRSLEYYREVHRVLAPHGVLISVGVARGDDDVFVTALSVFHRVTWFEPFCIIAGDDPQLIDDARLAKVVEERRTLIGEMASPLLDAPRIEKHMGDLLDRACVRDDDLAGEFALGPKRETRARRCAREE